MSITIDYLKKLIPLGKVNNTGLNKIAATAVTHKLRKGDSLFSESGNKNHCYYLYAGELVVTDARGNQRRITTQDSMINYPLDPQSMFCKSAKVATDDAMIIQVSRSALYTACLKEIPPLNQLVGSTLQHLVERSKILDLAQGEKIYAIGSEDGHLYYLMNGAIRMSDREEKEALLDAETEMGSLAFGGLKPRPANAVVDSHRALVACLDSKELDTLITWQGMVGKPAHFDVKDNDVGNDLGIEGFEIDMGVEELDGGGDHEWLMTLLRSQTFFKVPPENVQKLADKMEPVNVKAGETIIRQNDPGDYYYVIREGNCKVIHNGVEVDQMGPTEAFGEEALLSGAPRNATIEMSEDGVLMRLSKSDFDQLMAPPMIDKVSTEQAVDMARKGAIFIDVRSREEYKNRRLIRSINLPLNLLRVKLSKLAPNKDKTFIVYCDTGVRSSAASFLMKQEGFDVHLLSDPQVAFRKMAAHND